ncbi:hypothetical protein [Rheinheimera maricola]|uniref:Glycosyltransferase family 1 protein n=1 Tax=Rheinheimera maricola TaxID=2793282 RepID=A0ABS7X595_9GAMM|nr:hypothetical protein [Rheinheimera maricola]MBZ9610334.1 hypothetical protein [Rheinheimera maricola]
MKNEFLSTRLFPKNNGAEAYIVTGLAARCDWVILSDHKAPQVYLKYNNSGKSPDTIFLSLRNLRAVLPFFVEEVLPKLTQPFVLISGSEDVTLPNQIDKRWPALTSIERELITTILKHVQLSHWFVENLDDAISNKMTPIPVGMVYPDSQPASVIEVSVPLLELRPLRVLCAHRVREGQQWQLRKDVSQIAMHNWQHFATVLTTEVTEAEFIDLVKQHSFVICAQGGGLDPCPKAWLALYYGAIPIIQTSALEEAYRHLPVVQVDDWQPDTLTVEKLRKWQSDLRHHFDTTEGRASLLQKLTLDYWWQLVLSKVNAE